MGWNFTKFLVEDLDERSKAVGGARGVADDGLIGAVTIGVDAHNVGGDVSLSRGRDQNLLGSGLDVLSGAFSVHENSGTLDHQIDPQFPAHVRTLHK